MLQIFDPDSSAAIQLFRQFQSFRKQRSECPVSLFIQPVQFFVFFQGVESAFYVWINGHEVGYGEDSYTPAHFNITPYLQDRTNIIAVQVFRCSDGSYVED
jgi:hypothetical protein